MTPTPTAPAVEVRALSKTYGHHRAVDGLDLTIDRGEIFAILGPNGAGKTTTVEILEGFRTADVGLVRVLGEDPATAGRAWRSRIGVVLQDSRDQPEFTSPAAASGTVVRVVVPVTHGAAPGAAPEPADG